MLSVRLATPGPVRTACALPVQPSDSGPAQPLVPFGADERGEIDVFLADAEHTGRAGQALTLPRPLRTPAKLILVGVGDGTEHGWRAAGAALVRAARREPAVTILLPPGAGPEAVRGLAEGALLASYRYRLRAESPDTAARLRRVTIAVDTPQRYAESLRCAQAVAEATGRARDMVNTPALTKSPAWLAHQIVRAARPLGVDVRVREPAELAAEGFGGLVAVGGGSVRGPRLVEMSWRPAGARTHVVLVGKGITFDTGGIDLKSRDGMKLMRKDMAGAAAVSAATLGAARIGLPVRVTTLAPLAENMPSGSAYRPGDVVRHFGGLTSEIRNTDAEGRLVLADALAYAADRLAPDVLIDMATLTGAATVALGKRTAGLYSENDSLAGALAQAADAAGERVWRMPLAEDYLDAIRGDVADLNNSPDIGAGSVTAALYLREFTGVARQRWAHLDMSAPAWADGNDGELVKGATGWGVRTLIRWLSTLA